MAYFTEQELEKVRELSAHYRALALRLVEAAQTGAALTLASETEREASAWENIARKIELNRQDYERLGAIGARVSSFFFDGAGNEQS